MNAAEFDERFDNGEDAFEIADWQEVAGERRLSLWLPAELTEPLKKESERAGIPWGDLVRQWVSDRLAALAPAE